MMKFDAAAALKLFTDGHVGASLLNSLPAEAFPDDGSTWNHFAAMTDEHRIALRNNTFSSPAANTTLLKRTPSPKQLTKFLSINTHSPEHRIWSANDVYAAHQRSSFGASLMVLRFCKPDGTFTDPLIVVAGPMAKHLEGEASDPHAKALMAFCRIVLLSMEETRCV
jgi:hypothetical protein